MLFVLTGCSLNQQEIFNAALKTQDVNSKQAHTELTFHLSGSGFNSDAQQQVDNALMLLNNTTLSFDTKVKGNEDKTVAQAQVIMNVATPQMNLNVPIWVDSDLTETTPKLTEIIKLPQIAKASLPEQFQNKDYMVLTPLTMKDPTGNTLDMTKFLEFSKTLRTKEISFLESYAKQFNPNFDTVSSSSEYLTTDDGSKLVSRYEIRLDDKQLKDLIRYTVNNFVQNKEALAFVKDFMDFSLQMSQTPDKEKNLAAFDQAFAQFDEDKQADFLAGFNNVMDQLQGVRILGDKGLDLQYYLYNGYLIKESGVINLNLDLAKMSQFMQALKVNGQQSSPVEPEGTLDMLINFNTDVTGINAPVDISFPELDKTNSFNMTEMTDLLGKGVKKD
ncbi:hypothetical protein [Candidatus Desulfosporosinus nitrosoreducens]|uniref:hypothetical protein n=1 Tax=Candidatus Desulfosporosinus nitrosoreducens TaxID=3401928 RepID=UPI00280B2898|nr:hypothetical protein [Desulfosporosinus sp. PR]